MAELLGEWFRAMRTIIILLVLAPVMALLMADGDMDKAALLSNLYCLMALAIGFPIDWWRLQRRKRG